MLRRQSYGSILAGACGQIFGNNPIWHFDSPNWHSEPYRGTWRSNLDSEGAREQRFVWTLFSAFKWRKLVPRTDNGFVTSDLGQKDKRLYPALASDGSFAMIYVPCTQKVIINMSSFSPRHVRARLFDPARGTYGAVDGSPFINSGIVSIRTGGERRIVLDAAS